MGVDDLPGTAHTETTWVAPLEPLVSRYGVVNAIRHFAPPRGLHDLSLVGAAIGSGAPGRTPDGDQVAASGRAVKDPVLARGLALAEAAERYSAWEPADSDHLWATTDQLPGPFLDPAGFARCSADEYAQPACPVRPFDGAAPIRWTRARDFFTGADIWVPTCAATYRLTARHAAEHFSYPISTGFAVHTDWAEAVFSGVAEVIERDAIALLWLQRLPLPRIPESLVGRETRELIRWCREHHIQAYLFDATTDVGLPTTYVVLRSVHDSVLRHIVGASAGLTTRETAYKAMLEAVCGRATLSTLEPAPENFADFSDVSDGARYSGAARHADAFKFLLTPHPDRREFRPAPPFADNARDGIHRLQDRLADVGTQAAVVDRTCGELTDVGLVAVNVIVPGLQPMSLHPLARFTDHPRVYDAPVRMGYRALGPDDLTRLPQPFA